VNGRFLGGRTPLISAAEAGSVPALKALIAAGADASLRDDEHRSPLDAARELQHHAACDLLAPLRHTAAPAKKAIPHRAERE
jgi:ankyrin repeat protein